MSQKLQIILKLHLLLLTTISQASQKQACLEASRSSKTEAMAICEEAFQNSQLTDEKSIILITQAEYLIRNNQFVAANQKLEMAFNSNPKMLENGIYRLNWLRAQGSLFVTKEEFKAALPFYQQALDVAVEMKSQNLIANAYNDLGAISQHLGQYETALEWLGKSLLIHQQASDHYRSALNLANTAEVLQDSRQFKKALDYYQNALSHYQKHIADHVEDRAFHEPYLARIHQSLGGLYSKMDLLEKASEQFNLALNIYQKYQLTGKQIKVLSELGKLHLKNQQSQQALSILYQAAELEQNEESAEYVALKESLVAAFIANEQFADAEKAALSGIKMAQSKDNQDSEAQFLKLLSTLSEKQGEYVKAMNYLKMHHTIQDQLFEKKFNQSIIKRQSEIDYVQSQFEIKQLETQKVQQSLLIQKQRWMALALSLLIVCLVLYLAFLLRKKNQSRIKLKTDQASHSQQLAEMSYESFDFKRLFNGLNCQLLCFDITGKILFNHGVNSISGNFNNKTLQKICPEAWLILNQQLDEEEILKQDLLLSVQDRQSKSILPKQSVWIHQLPYLDDLLLAVFMSTEKEGYQSNESAEKIRKHSEYKVLLSQLLNNTSKLPIQEINQHNMLLSTLRNQSVKQKLNQANQSEVREMAVELMKNCLDIWQQSTETTALELAEESGLWLVSIDEGRLRIRTFSRYLHIDKLPKNPRWQQVIKTAHFVLSHCEIDFAKRQQLNQQIQNLKSAILNLSKPYRKG